MPEGDTILCTARSLDRALAGKALVRFEAPRLRFRPFTPAAVVELTEHPAVDHLGPDLCRADADLDEVVRRRGTYRCPACQPPRRGTQCR